MRTRFLMACAVAAMISVGCDKQSSTTAGSGTTTAPAATTPHVAVGPLKLSVGSSEVASEFGVYVGGGSNIDPPDTIGSGGIPLISFSNGGPAFMAGKLNSPDGKTKFVRITCDVENPTDKLQSFKIGDLSLTVSGTRSTEFAAVGYGSKLCAMSDGDRKTVAAVAVDVSPKGHRTVSYVFALLDPTATTGELSLQNSVGPVTVKIDSQPPK